MRAATLAGAHEFISQLPDGYDTLVGEHGSTLSGGQRQRIAIARALVGDPRILILDEATSALDYESESIIQRNLTQICQGRTVFLIAHRLSTLRPAHRILAARCRGDCVEQGTHDDLLRLNGRYARLYRLQNGDGSRLAMGRAERPRGPELEFLPEVLEVQLTPPSPIGRATTWTVMAVLMAAVVWATVSRVDVVAVARGKVIPSGHSKVVQPLDGGIIRAIRVREGQAVRRGQVLVELDPTASDADLSRLAHEHLAVQLDGERLRALMDGRPGLDAPKGVDPKLVALQEQRLLDQRSEYESRLESARLLVEQRQAAVEATRADSERLELIVPMLAERAAAYRKLLDNEFVGRLQYLEVEQQRVEKVQELAMTRHRLSRDLAALGEARTQWQVIEMEFKRTRLAELAEVETRAASLSQDVVKASQRARIQRLVAPIDGVVQQLAVHTVGGVVTPAQSLMVIVPGADRLEVEAWIENKDIGFVRVGQDRRGESRDLPLHPLRQHQRARHDGVGRRGAPGTRRARLRGPPEPGANHARGGRRGGEPLGRHGRDRGDQDRHPEGDRALLSPLLRYARESGRER